jgi:transcriptional regulator with XRE-family HTH domain
MSDSLNISISGYSKLERNETEISISRLNKIAEILEVDLKTLMEFDEEKVFAREKENLGSERVNVIRTLEALVAHLKEENSYLREILAVTLKK